MSWFRHTHRPLRELDEKETIIEEKAYLLWAMEWITTRYVVQPRVCG
jgi:hypothetical protein